MQASAEQSRTPSESGIATGDPAEALRQSEQRLRLMIDSVKDYAIFMLDPSGAIVSWNAGAQRLTGYTAEEIVGRHISVLYTAEDRRAGLPQRDLASAAQWGTHETDGVRERRDQTRYWAHLTTTALRDEAGTLQGFVRVNRDITEQRTAQEALRESAERLRAIVDAAVDAIITIDERGLIQAINPATERIFGYTPEELIGRNINMLMPEPYHSEHDGYLRNYLQTGQARIIGTGREVSARRKDGTVFPVDLAVSEVRLGNHRLFTGMIRDITERHRLQQELLEITAAERRRIGQDLHDGLCQQLAGAGMSLELLRSQLIKASERCAPNPGTPAPLAEELRKLAGSADGLIDLLGRSNAEARAVARGLNPVTLETRGLPAALEELAGNLSRAHGVPIELSCDIPENLVAPDLAHHLYRMAQEAANNALRHGRAEHVWISCSAGDTILKVEDDGVGFDPAARRWEAKKASEGASGMGLDILDYRARMIGGRLNIRPRQPRGTILEVTRVGAPMRFGT